MADIVARAAEIVTERMLEYAKRQQDEVDPQEQRRDYVAVMDSPDFAGAQAAFIGKYGQAAWDREIGLHVSRIKRSINSHQLGPVEQPK